MPLHLRTSRPRFFILIAGLGLWGALLALLAQDACLDLGGAISGPGFACAQPDGSLASIWELVSPMLAVSLGFLLLLPAALIFRLSGRRVGGPK